MTGNSIWTEEIHVEGAETDFQERWKPASFFLAMQGAAGHHASALGFDFREMVEREMVWVLARMKIIFQRFPVTGERAIIRTWPKGIHQKLFYLRDFQFLGENGEQFASATSCWLLINPTMRRILPPQALPGQVPDNQGRAALDEVLEKISPPGEMEDRFTTQAGYSAIDLMGHVNNARYIDWICDCFTIDHWNTHQLQGLQINYVNEVRPGVQVLVSAGQDGQNMGNYFVVGMNLTTGARAFEAAASWSSKQAG